MAVSSDHTRQTQVSLREKVERQNVLMIHQQKTVHLVFICEIHVTVRCQDQTSRPSGREVDDALKVCVLCGRLLVATVSCYKCRHRSLSGWVVIAA